ncbi:MAG: asparagine synthase (glutamine-hydrolyzing), partial [Bacillota bacterium]
RTGGRVALGHTRLSILDLSPAGHQPMHCADGSMTMVFNGEVYNFAAIRDELESRGHRFRSTGDSEVILAAFREWGMAAVDRFIGMFAIALWDERARRLMLLRDRMGVKPLYYAWNGQALWFGSELKALRAHDAWRPEIDREALAEYLQYGYVCAPRAIYKGVHKLLPGHWLELGEIGEPAIHRYWAPPVPTDERIAMPEPELERHLEHLLIDAFRHRMVSDVPLGVFLSGGIDSSLVAAILKIYGGGELRTYTIGFDDARFDESRWARRVAQHLGTRHTEQILTGRDMREVLTHWADLFDEPFGDSSGVPTYLVSRLARNSVKVALSADGGDELFHGYSHYGVCMERERSLARVPAVARHAVSRSLARFAPGGFSGLSDRLPVPSGWRHFARRNVGERLDKLNALLPNLDRALIYDFALTSWAPWEIAPLVGLAPPRHEPLEEAATFAEQMSHRDLRYFLPDDILVKVDRTTMATGLEGREPLLDHRLVEFALRLPLDQRRGRLGPKHLLRRVLYKYVPRELLERPKQGFAVPLASWLRGELAPLVHHYLAPQRIADSGLFEPALVARAVANFQQGGSANDRLDSQKLWYLLAFEMWREKWMRKPNAVAREMPHARAVHHQ